MISQAITSTLRFIITIQIYFSQASPHSMFYYIYLFAFIIISNSSRLPFVLAFRLFSFCFSCCLFIDFSLNDTLSPVISWSFCLYQPYKLFHLLSQFLFFLFVLYYSTFSGLFFFINSSCIFLILPQTLLFILIYILSFISISLCFSFKSRVIYFSDHLFISISCIFLICFPPQMLFLYLCSFEFFRPFPYFFLESSCYIRRRVCVSVVISSHLKVQ